MIDDVIVALATPPMSGALAIIRVSGKESFALLKKIFSNKSKPLPHKVFYGNIVDEEEIIDEVLVSTFVGPNSFTGEDCFEINCHGGMFVVQKIIAVCLKNGARLAEKGEYSRRAFLNNKMDLVQAEAINDLINSTSEEEASLAMMGLKGSTSEMIGKLKKEMLDLVSGIEVNIDYPEYDDAEIITKEIISKQLKNLITKIDEILKDAKVGQMIKEGIKVAIVGRPNVGKSSLLNALIQEEKAIVTDEAGTTRDVVEAYLNLDGLKIKLLDTAGIRENTGLIEKIGIEKAKHEMKHADLVLLVLDDSSSLQEEDQILLDLVKDKNHIIVINKKDKGKGLIKEKGIKISAKDNDINELKEEIKRKVGYELKYLNKPMITNARHVGLLKLARKSLVECQKEINKGMPIDLVNIEIIEALKNVEDILGNRAKIDLVEEIFSRFCLGK